MHPKYFRFHAFVLLLSNIPIVIVAIVLGALAFGSDSQLFSEVRWAGFPVLAIGIVVLGQAVNLGLKRRRTGMRGSPPGEGSPQDQH